MPSQQYMHDIRFPEKKVLHIFTLNASKIEFWIAQTVLPVVGSVPYLARTR
jgi:hypothetical protein